MVYGCLSPAKLEVFFLEILEGWLLYWPDVGFFFVLFFAWDYMPPAQGPEGEFLLSHSMPWASLWTTVCLGERRTEDLCSLLPDGSQRPLKFLLKIPAGLNINICRFKVRWHHCISHILTARLKPLLLASSPEVHATFEVWFNRFPHWERVAILHLAPHVCRKGLCCLTLLSHAIQPTKAQYMLIMQWASKSEWRSKPVMLIILCTDFLQDWGLRKVTCLLSKQDLLFTTVVNKLVG